MEEVQLKSIASVEVYGKDGSGPFPIKEKVVAPMIQALLLEHLSDGKMFDVKKFGSTEVHPRAQPLFTLIVEGIKHIAFAVPLN